MPRERREEQNRMKERERDRRGKKRVETTVNYSLHLSLTRITIENGCFFATHYKYTLRYVRSRKRRTFSFLYATILRCEYVVCFGFPLLYTLTECEVCYLPNFTCNSVSTFERAFSLSLSRTILMVLILALIFFFVNVFALV